MRGRPENKTILYPVNDASRTEYAFIHNAFLIRCYFLIGWSVWIAFLFLGVAGEEIEGKA